MPFVLRFTDSAKQQLEDLRRDQKKLRKVTKCLALLEVDPAYPALNSHRYVAFKVHDGSEVWESYVENKTPAAWRVFWQYGPEKGMITILAITRHP